DPYDPTSIPSAGNWERNLGTNDLKGKRPAIVPAIGGLTLEPGVEYPIRSEAETLAEQTRMVVVELVIRSPYLPAQWMMGNLATLLGELGPHWPSCARDLTDEVAMGLCLSQSFYNLTTAAAAEDMRVEAIKAMAAAFEEVDFIVAATNPGPAFAADSTTSNPEQDLT